MTFSDDQLDLIIAFADAADLPLGPYKPEPRPISEPPDSLISPPCGVDNWMGEDK